MNTASHAHVLDPDWSQEPIPWAETADATMPARIHAACMDDCWDCLEALAHEAAVSAETTTIVMSMGFGVYVMLPDNMRRTVDEKLAYAAAFGAMIDRIKDAPGQSVSGPEVLAMTRALDADGRWEVVDASIQLMGLYTQVLQGKEQ